MGLISDYLEQNRETFEFDPCMYGDYISTSYNTSMFISSQYREKIRKDVDGDNIKRNEDRINELKKDARQLDELIAKSIVREKLTRYILNNVHLEAAVTRKTIETLLDEITSTRLEAVDMLSKIQRKLSGKLKSQTNVDEAREQANIKDILLFSIFQYIKRGSPGSSAEFRILIRDYANIIGTWEPETKKKSKELFEDYITTHFNVKKSKYRCPNCNAVMYSGIPFCLNCYEKESV